MESHAIPVGSPTVLWALCDLAMRRSHARRDPHLVSERLPLRARREKGSFFYHRMSGRSYPMKSSPRNHVALALLARGGGTKVHKKTRKAMRRAESMKLKKEI
jgi:hypothetical protein